MLIQVSKETPEEGKSYKLKFSGKWQKSHTVGFESDLRCLCLCYREVDENPDYDNLDIVNRDAEDKYFDDDDDEEEEEEEENMTE